MNKLTIVLIAFNLDDAAVETINKIPNNIFVITKVFEQGISSKKLLHEKHTLIEKKDTGIYDAMNQALEHVKTEYVMYIGVGDFVNKKGCEYLSLKIQEFPKYDCFVFPVKLKNRLTKIDSFGEILFYHHQGTVLKTSLIRNYSGFIKYDLHADLYLLNRIHKSEKMLISINKGIYLVDYDLGGVSNSGDNSLKSFRELIDIFKELESNIWSLGHLKALMRPIYYWIRYKFG